LTSSSATVFAVDTVSAFWQITECIFRHCYMVKFVGPIVTIDKCMFNSPILSGLLVNGHRAYIGNSRIFGAGAITGIGVYQYGGFHGLYDVGGVAVAAGDPGGSVIANCTVAFADSNNSQIGIEIATASKAVDYTDISGCSVMAFKLAKKGIGININSTGTNTSIGGCLVSGFNYGVNFAYGYSTLTGGKISRSGTGVYILAQSASVSGTAIQDCTTGLNNAAGSTYNGWWFRAIDNGTSVIDGGANTSANSGTY